FVETGLVTTAFWTRSLILLLNLSAVLSLSRWWMPVVSTWLHLPPAAMLLVLTHLATTTCWVHIQQALQAAKLPRIQGCLLAAERGQVLVFSLLLAAIGRA